MTAELIRRRMYHARCALGVVAFLAILPVLVARLAYAESLDIYFIDVEGGQATLLVMPDKESLLIDTGFAGPGGFAARPGDPGKARDAQRILAAARDASIAKIDYLLITHFHGDHFGGVVELSQLLPIKTVIDHDSAAPEALNTPISLINFDAYRQVRAQREHLVPDPGERIPPRSVEVTVVSTNRATLNAPLAGAGEANAACNRSVPAPSEIYENPRSTGVLIRFGAFGFLDLGDLAGEPLSDLVCPINLIGPVDVYLVPHHGSADSADPATLAAFRPRVAILNNGATKGGSPEAIDVLHAAMELQDVWQLHRSENDGVRNFAAARNANLDESTAHWLKLSAKRDGSFRILNRRTGEWVEYGVE